MTTATSDLSPDLLGVEPAAGVSRWAAAYELAKPRLNLLVLVTTAVGFFAAAGWAGTVGSALLFLNCLVGTALTAAGAGALNQWIERDVDARMPRTRGRPLPANALSPAFAFGFGAILGLGGTLWLWLSVNLLAAALALATLLIYVAIYTPLKSRTPLCTIVGAVPGAIPPVIGVAGANGPMWPLGVGLFAILFCWQMPHFFGLATLYRDDYRRGGLRMLPGEPNGQRRTSRQAILWSALLLPASLLPALSPGIGWLYAIAAVALGLWFFVASTRMARGGRAEAKRLFLTSIAYLPLLLLALCLDRLL